MVWWWSSSSDAKPEPQQPTPTSVPIPSASPPSPSPSQTQANEAEFNAAFPQLAPPSSTTSTTLSPTDPSSPDYDPSIPTTMSCRSAFDSAFYCSSLGGHFNDIYRYGQLRSCSEHWADWRFCMTLKSYSKKMQAEAIQERYKEKEGKMKENPNSEDVWRKRGPGEMIERPFGRAEEEVRRVAGNGL